MLLNPRLNETNILHELNLTHETAYCKKLSPVQSMGFSWSHLLPSLKVFGDRKDIQYHKEIPTIDRAKQNFLAHQISVSNLDWGCFRSFSFRTFRDKWQLKLFLSAMLYVLKHPTTWKHLPYPMALSYSDFLVIPQNAIAPFLHLCGVFAGMKLFVEVAVPTAMILSCQSIRQEHDNTLKGIEYWTEKEVNQFLLKYNKQLKVMIDDFPENVLYIHPVKLSQFI